MTSTNKAKGQVTNWGKLAAAKTPARRKANFQMGKRREVTLQKRQEEAGRDTTTREKETRESGSTLPPKRARQPGGPGCTAGRGHCRGRCSLAFAGRTLLLMAGPRGRGRILGATGSPHVDKTRK